MTKRIVVIDDEPDVLSLVRASLVTKGYDVFTSTEGVEGLAEAERQPPDLIICDLMMPRVSGLEVLKRLRKMPTIRTTPVIILSTIGDAERPREFWIKSLGVDDYIVKPFDPLDLMGRVEYIFRRQQYKSVQNPALYAAVPQSPSRTDDTLSPTDMVDLTPHDVVKTFIESWNKQDFATEFDCLGEELHGGSNARDYAERRRQTYIQEKGQSRVQRMKELLEEKISLNISKVVVEREDVIGGVSKTRRETFSLKKTHKGWKIIAVRNTPPPAPPPPSVTGPPPAV